ncbi:hypothetical protein M0R04_11080 [Candidatus Dojkabacteria bacterium]|jgi:hypothetical protein|nr:hypothetical protein [Candidatus Dojkabacteria bacterium]
MNKTKKQKCEVLAIKELTSFEDFWNEENGAKIYSKIRTSFSLDWNLTLRYIKLHNGRTWFHGHRYILLEGSNPFDTKKCIFKVLETDKEFCFGGSYIVLLKIFNGEIEL